MKVHPSFAAKRGAYKLLVGAIVGSVVLGAVPGGAAFADPDRGGAVNVQELFHEVEHLSETILNAQPDLDTKLQLLSEADKKHAADLARLEATRTQLAAYQGAVDQFAVAAYMGGRTDDFSALLTASSPSNLIDTLATQRVLNTEMSQQLQGLRRASGEAQLIEAASAKSAADAKAAVDEAVAVRANLENERAELRTQLARFNASYAKLPPAQQAELTLPSADVTAALGPIAPIPTVGTNGLVPNARILLDYIMATYPGVQSIGGVRADARPDHPSGRALDIMIGSDMGLGDAINADLLGQAGRFGIDYTMWRVAAHFDHVHVTVS